MKNESTQLDINFSDYDVIEKLRKAMITDDNYIKLQSVVKNITHSEKNSKEFKKKRMLLKLLDALSVIAIMVMAFVILSHNMIIMHELEKGLSYNPLINYGFIIVCFAVFGLSYFAHQALIATLENECDKKCVSLFSIYLIVRKKKISDILIIFGLIFLGSSILIGIGNGILEKNILLSLFYVVLVFLFGFILYNIERTKEKRSECLRKMLND